MLKKVSVKLIFKFFKLSTKQKVITNNNNNIIIITETTLSHLYIFAAGSDIF